MQEAHRTFSADCFNACWDLIDRHDRSEADTETMRRLAYASLWHWTQREDCTSQNMSIGYWQVSRVEALAGNAELARRYGTLSLESAQSGGLEPFYAGYAREAIARACALSGDIGSASEALEAARADLGRVDDPESASMLKADLEAVAKLLNR